MNVTVVGSYRQDQKQRLQGTKKEFQRACSTIGKNLARWGHRLIVPHPDNEDTAEVHALRGFQEAAEYRFYPCVEHKGDPVLKAHFDAVEKSDAVILIGGLNGTYAAGLSALRRRKLILPVPAFGGSAKDLCEIPDIDNMMVDEIRNLKITTPDWEQRLVEAVGRFLSAYPRVLIIHGRGDGGTDLREKITLASMDKESELYGIAPPHIMNLSGRGAISVPDLFEQLASQVSAAIAIVTADDVGGFARLDKGELSAKELTLAPRARENVWVEVGWFWGRLGRQCIFLWLKDDIKLPTDLQGAAWTRSDKIDGAWDSIKSFLRQLRGQEPTT